MADKPNTQSSKAEHIGKEKQRLLDADCASKPWRRWGPYLSERSWGTVREDYSPDGSAWDYLSHDMARSKAYRWGEDGLAGISDRYQLLCFGLALWNGKDPLLKERAFGLTPNEGNHGEDLKEYYFYLDSTPTHSYMRYLYKYPQSEFPYQHLVDENRSRQGRGEEYELLDTGIFDDDRYFDVFVDYAKADAEDMCIRIEVHNRGPEPSQLHILPQLWFRNTWAWTQSQAHEQAPVIRADDAAADDNFVCLVADDSASSGLTNLPFSYELGERRLYAEADGELLFTNNETNTARVYGVEDDTSPVFSKDAFHRHVIHGESCVNPAREGSKACVHFTRTIPAGGKLMLRLRLTDQRLDNPLADVDSIIDTRRAEADEFYAGIHPAKASEDECRVQRQAFAGLMWGKQNYIFDVEKWLSGDNPNDPPPDSRKHIRNEHWRHLNSQRILSMPDTWEYPWFAAWDLAFHTVPIALIDPVFAKEQLLLMLFEQFQHPNGQIPAYEWEFSDLNPPVHAWAVWRVYNMDRIRSGKADTAFLEKCFHKLMINFAWWINKVDKEGNNVFEGGFLGLDNITLFDRSEKMPDGATLEQSDASGWMGMYCQNLMRISLELAKTNPVYEGLATKYFQHYVYVGAAMKHMGAKGDHNLWDENDGFFYDVLRYPGGSYEKLRVRSLVGLIPLFAVERLEEHWIKPFKEFTTNFGWFIENRQDIVEQCVNLVSNEKGNTHVLTIVNPAQLERILQCVWDANEFRSSYGMRSLSRYHSDHPYILNNSTVRYEPAEADCKIKGGNSNWRGPIWFPTTFLMIESLRKLDAAYGTEIKITTADGVEVCAGEMAKYFANAMISIFTRDADGKRPVYARVDKFQHDPHWRDYITFFEYFDGDNGKGLGASHQTGWTALVASLIDEWRQ
ncbi:MAG: glucosidase [Gammaproteobacteria bacterium]